MLIFPGMSTSGTIGAEAPFIGRLRRRSHTFVAIPRNATRAAASSLHGSAAARLPGGTEPNVWPATTRHGFRRKPRGRLFAVVARHTEALGNEAPVLLWSDLTALQ